ncbi:MULTISPECIES: L,D-transpeptidase family protein [Methylophaga]|uniref:Putative L,D-transpeptidase YcfS n=1 Tax=Methylophaga muralis TaxID=291169 RepID=A0A1E3GR69_9GAMM|nr:MULTISPECIES: L,D-transpeptidase family protein [Methylophaga]ODN66517.1 putative L,D-transpeptidase YcfS precursor [Methylophaga muralis]THF54984.1 MAG: peptigoglycan-binding protein LysM [Methylophaga nitratireducenticrescens]THK43118.1 peptigoglycan-binding protein LysM [Methylophaga sp. SB9B]
MISRLFIGLASSLLVLPVGATTFELADEETRVIGHNLVVYSRHEDTLLDIGRKFDLGYTEMTAANPNLDPWLPGDNKPVLIPNKFILPDAPQKGIVINIPEMRLFYFPPKQANQLQQVITHPIGIGREGRDTPLGKLSIIQKRENPSWTPPESVRREHAAAGDILPAVVPPGPDNPLGTRAIRLSNPSYLIHGTAKPYGVGLRVSSGCIRLYPEDIEHLYSLVSLNTQVNILHQPYKAAVSNGKLFLEAHAPIPEMYKEVSGNMTPMIQAILNAQDSMLSEQDWPFAEEIVMTTHGVVKQINQQEEKIVDNVWFVHGGLQLNTGAKMRKALQDLNMQDKFWPLRNKAINEVVVGPFENLEAAREAADKISAAAGIPVWPAHLSEEMF